MEITDKEIKFYVECSRKRLEAQLKGIPWYHRFTCGKAASGAIKAQLKAMDQAGI